MRMYIKKNWKPTKMEPYSEEALSRSPKEVNWNTAYEFDLPTPRRYTPTRVNINPMDYVLKVGKHKGKTLYELMKTPSGRSYLKWMRGWLIDNEEYRPALENRNQKIDACFLIYEDYVSKRKTPDVQSNEENAKRAKTT